MTTVETHNVKVRENKTKIDKGAQVEVERETLRVCKEKCEAIRQEIIKKIAASPMPLKAITVENGQLKYKGQHWDQIGTSRQYMVALALCNALNPQCGFALVDRIESLDLEAMKMLNKWAENKGIRIIATKVADEYNADFHVLQLVDGEVKEEKAS